MSNTDTLTKLLAEVRRLTREAVEERKMAPPGSSLKEYHRGRHFAYNAVVHLIDDAIAKCSRPAPTRAEPWAPPDLGDAPPPHLGGKSVKPVTDTEIVKSLATETEAMRQRAEDFEQHGMRMQVNHEERISNLETAFRKLYEALA